MAYMDNRNVSMAAGVIIGGIGAYLGFEQAAATGVSPILGALIFGAAGFVVDRIQSQPPVSQYARLHEAAQNTSFGRFGPVFQYVWAFGHLPREGERWPQKGNAQLIRRRCWRLLMMKGRT